MRDSFASRVLSAFLAFTLVTGLSPMTALAAQENSGGNASADEIQVQEADAAADSASDEPAEGEQVPAAEQDTEDAESLPVSEAADTPDSQLQESVEKEQAAEAVEPDALPEANGVEPAKAEAPASDGEMLEAQSDDESSAVESDDGDGFLDEDANEDATDNGETSGSVLAPWEGGEFTELTLDVPVTADVSTGEKWFSFTPGKSGLYKFAASDPESADPYGYLYDANGNELASDDDSAGDSCFLIQRFLDADEVYYLKASTFASNEGESYLVAVGETDTYDFGGYYLNYGNTYLTVGADPLEAMEVSFSCKVDSSVALPEDAYTTQLWRYNEDQGEYETVDGLDEPGDYRIVFTPVDPYYGSDKEIDFNVFAQNNLATAKVNIEPLVANGEVQHPSYTVTVGGVELEEGTHYTAKWTCYDEDRGESVVVDGPSELDTYYNFTITAVEGSGYDGALSTGYSLNDRPYISEVIDWPNGHSFAKTGEPVVPEVVLTWNGEALTEGVDYEVSYYSEDADIYEEDALPEAPTEIGTYQVMFTGKGSFQGTYSDWFYIERSYDAHDLYYASANVIGGSFVVGQMPEDFGAEVWQCDEDGSYLDDEPLREDEDYVVTYQRYAGEEDGTELWDDVDFDGTVPGRYQMKITGVEPYFGTCYAYFFDVYAANDLAIADVVVDEKSLVLVNGKATPSVTVYLDDEVVDPAEYEVRYSKSEDEGLLELPLTQAGWYDLFVVAKEGGAYTGESHSEVLVTLSTDLSRAQIELENSELDYTGQPVELSATVTSAAGDVLTLGEDYKLLYITEDDYSDWEGEEGVWSEQAPSESGEYYVRAQGLGQYEGETHSVQFVIVDPYDIGNTWTSLSYGTDYLVEGQFPDDFAVHVYLPDEDEDGDSVRLEEGEDFSVVYERLKADDADEDDAVWEAVEDIAAQPAGEYRAVIEGVAPYHGKKYREFTIYAANDLATADVTVNDGEHVILFKDGGVRPTTIVKLGDQVLTEGDDYVAEYEKNGDSDDIHYAPLGLGSYVTRIVAKDGSSYRGERSDAWVYVVAQNDLSYANIDRRVYTYPENGDPVQLDFTAAAVDGTLLKAGTDYRVLYISEEDYWNDEDDAWTEEAPSKVGKYRFRIEGQGDYEGVSGARTFKIIDTHDIGELDYYRGYSGRLFAGNVPSYFGFGFYAYSLDDDEDLVKLVQDVDYKLVGYERYDEDSDEWLTVDDLSEQPAGEYRAVFKGIGSYHGTANRYFDLEDPLDMSCAYVWSHDVYIARGETSAMPDVEVELNGKPLSGGTDYAVAYEQLDEGDDDDAVISAFEKGPLPVGRYRAVVVAAEGSSYYGSTSDTFRVYDALDLSEASFGLDEELFVADGKPVKIELAYAEAVDDTALQPDDYEFLYRDAEDDGSEWTTVAPSALGYYYVALRGIANGYHGVSDSACSFRIVAANDITYADVYEGSNYVANGGTCMPELQVILHGKELVEGADYVVTYFAGTSYDDDTGEYIMGTPTAAPLKTGYYTARIMPANDAYIGETTYDFEVRDRYSLEGADFWQPWYFAATGKPVQLQEDAWAEAVDGKPLTYGKDYTWVFYDEDERPLASAPSAEGKYYFALKGIGKYSGYSRIRTFLIVAANDLAAAKVGINGRERGINYYKLPYTGNVISPISEVTMLQDGETVVLKEGVDYTVTTFGAYDEWSGKREVVEMKEIGYYEVTLTPVEGSAYTGTQEFGFTVTSASSLETAYVGDGSERVFAYTGKPIEYKPTVTTFYGKTLVEGVDFNYEYEQYGYGKRSSEGCLYPGTYIVRAVPTPESGYTDYGWSFFQIVDYGEDYVQDLSEAQINVVDDGLTYTGAAQNPAVGVTLNGAEVPADEYDVAYSNNVNAGTATVTVTGKGGSYTGSATATFKIAPASIKGAKLVLAKASYTYNGKAQKPAVKTVGGKALKAGTDYTVTYSNANSKDAGSYTITVTGKGNYAGTSAKATYKIAKAKNPLAVKAVAKSVKAKAAKKKAQVVSGGVKVTKKGIGAVTYAKVAKGSAKQLTVNKKNGKITVKKGTKKGTYKVKVKVTAKGNKNYQSANKTVTVTVKVK